MKHSAFTLTPLFALFISLIGFVPTSAVASQQPPAMLPPPPEHYIEPVEWVYKGAAFPAYASDSYAQPNARDYVDYLLEAGVNTIQIVPSWFQSDMTSHNIARDENKSPSDESIEEIIDYIHGKGATVLLKPHLEPEIDWFGNEGGWRGVIRPDDPEAWFASYTAFVVHYAEMAQAKEVALFSIGTEMASMTQGMNAAEREWNQARWLEMLEAVREVYDKGKVMYAAHEYGVVGGYYDAEPHFSMAFERLPASFWQPFDYAGTTVYYDIHNPEIIPTTTPTVETLLDGWYKNDVAGRHHGQEFLVDELTAWQVEHGKEVIFAEIGYRSIDYCAYHPFIASEYVPNYGTELVYNDECQANAYEAAFTIWGGKPWLKGSFWWQFVPLVAFARECGADVDKTAVITYTPCGRPAAEVLSRWFDGASQPPDPPPAYVPDLPSILPFDDWDELTLERAIRPQTSGDIQYAFDPTIKLPPFSQSLRMTSYIPCDDPRYGQLDFTFTSPQDFSIYNSLVITARTKSEGAGELSVVLIDVLEHESEEWQSTRWLEDSDWQTFEISLTEGAIPRNSAAPDRDDPWAHPADLVIPPVAWQAPANDTLLDLTQIRGIRFKALSVTADCETTPEMVAWIGDIHLSEKHVISPEAVVLPYIETFDYPSEELFAGDWQVASTTGETQIGLAQKTGMESPALFYDNSLPCEAGRGALIRRQFLRPVDFSDYTHLTIRVAGDGLNRPPYGGEFVVVLWDAGSEKWEEWHSTRWYNRVQRENNNWQTFTIELKGSGIGLPWEHGDDFILPTWIPEDERDDLVLNIDKIAAIGLKANTADDGAGTCTHTDSLVYIDDITLSVGPPTSCKLNAANVSIIHGTSGNDTIKGTAGNDIIFGYGGDDHIEGRGGNDCLIGGAGNDRLYGDDGNDILWGGEINNSIVYEQGDGDHLYGGPDNDKLYGGGDQDRLQGDDGADGLYGNQARDNLYGNEGNDVLHGGDDDDKLEGGGQDDLLIGGRGHDHLRGNQGDDRLYGSEDRDKLYGNDGRDSLHGGSDDDTLQGGGDDDLVIGGAGRDHLRGDGGNDKLYGLAGRDRLYGFDGRDRLYGGGDNDIMQGGDGNDFVKGEAGDDHLRGDKGHDRLYGYAGKDKLYGGLGDDFLDGGADGDTLDGSQGDDLCLLGEHLRGCER